MAGGYSTSGSFGGGGFTPVRATAELYDPSSGTWTAASPKRPIAVMPTMATLLPNGKVLMACGCDHAGRASELYDPTTGSWTATGTMVANHGRDTAASLPDGTVTATLLADGKVLVAGGGSPTLPAAELYDPGTGSWSATAKMLAVRVSHTATLLPDGKVLVAGGEGDASHAGLRRAVRPGERTVISGARSMSGRLLAGLAVLALAAGCTGSAESDAPLRRRRLDRRRPTPRRCRLRRQPRRRRPRHPPRARPAR